MSHSNRSIAAREYKLILNNEQFEDREEGMKNFMDAIRGKLEALKNGGEAYLKEDRKEKKRSVWYLDTDDFKIKKNHFLLRIRREKDEQYVTSLKCRNPDRDIAASYDLSSNKQKIKTKFEEDIIKPFASNFSLSISFDTKNEPDIQSFKDLESIFPGLSVLNINANEVFNKVNNFEAQELSCQIGKIKFGDGESTDDMSLEFWYLPGEVTKQIPLIVEFTFDYGVAQMDKESKSRREFMLEEFPMSLVRKADAFYYSLQDIKEFIGPENAKTKTQFAYSYPQRI